MSEISPELIEALKQALLADPSAMHMVGVAPRSPLRPRQLTDLRLLPTATDPRPLFLSSADQPRDFVNIGHPYPRLLWSPEGVEITVRSKMEHDRKLGEGFVEVAPVYAAPDPMDGVAAELAALSEEDRTLVLEMQRQQRITALQTKLAQLSEAQLEQVIGAQPASEIGDTAAPKRGRPRKAEVA